MLSLIATVLTILSIIIGYFARRAHKRSMSEALGRNVSDSDMGSIGTWLEIEDKKEKAKTS